MDRIKYTCKNCGWSTSITAHWADLKPPRCMNAKCNTNFKKNPDSLQIDNPRLKKVAKKKLEKKVEAKVEKTSNKPQASRKTKQQQSKEEE